MHCNEIPFMYSFLGPNPNFYIYVSVRDLYIPRIGPHISCSRIGRSIVGIYKLLTYTWMWKWGMWPRNSFSGNICFEFSELVLSSVCNERQYPELMLSLKRDSVTRFFLMILLKYSLYSQNAITHIRNWIQNFFPIFFGNIHNFRSITGVDDDNKKIVSWVIQKFWQWMLMSKFLVDFSIGDDDKLLKMSHCSQCYWPWQ